VTPLLHSRRLRCALVGVALLAAWWAIGELRRGFIRAVVSHDAPPRPAPALPAATTRGAGLPAAPFVRVVLVDGAGRESAARMPAWNALCARGLDLVVDVGFPTVSLPVQVALWSGRTQQETGVVFRSGRPLVPPLGADAIPAQVAGSIAVAEASPYIVQSLGFADTRPPPTAGKKTPDGWAEHWVAEARAAVTSPAPLAFVHVLGVDIAGHKHGRPSAAWDRAVAAADALLVDLLADGEAAHPDARWFVLADHGHIRGGGHGGEQRSIRRVRACIAGPGVARDHGGPIALVDLARAIADSVGARLPAGAPGRPLSVAMAWPVGDELIPGVRLVDALLAALLLGLGALATRWGMGPYRMSLGPWWWPLAIAIFLVVRGVPTLSTPMIYPPQGKDLLHGFWPALLVLAPWAGLAMLRRPPLPAAAAMLALPLAGWLAAVVACGGLPLVWGAEIAPIVPRWTAWASVFATMAASGAGVVGLAALATAARPRFDRG
jgi:hypothetical protein